MRHLLPLVNCLLSFVASLLLLNSGCSTFLAVFLPPILIGIAYLLGAVAVFSLEERQ